MGPVAFRGPSRGPIEMTLRNQYVEDRRPFIIIIIIFFFGDHIKILRKRWHFSLKTFFFRRSHENPNKTEALSPSVLDHKTGDS